jgi:hypothetical protein
MSFLRWSAAMIAAIVSGLAAAGSWHAGLLTDLVAGVKASECCGSCGGRGGAD